jgi:hypothetical protein
MAIYQQSPGVQVVEKDASAVTVGLSTTIGAYVGSFQWGPVLNPMLVSNEGDLVKIFGTPDTNTYSHFFSAANFLSYTNAMWVTRVVGASASNASVAGSALLISNFDNYQASFSSGVNTYGTFAARYPGSKANGLKVSIADSATFAQWPYANLFSAAPGTSDYALSKGGSNDELHVIVIDALGKFTGSPGAVLEKYDFLSKASDAISYQGTNNYYVSVLANRSSYVYWMSHDVDGANWGGIATNTAFAALSGVPTDFVYTLSGGVDNNAVSDGNLQLGWDLFLDSQTYDVSLLVTGNASEALSAYVVNNIAAVRKDCVAFTSICKTGAPILGTSSTRIADAKAFKTFDSSYAVIDSGYKYMYDKYNDKYRWIALNADTAGLCAKVDATNDTWSSPAGMTKGQIKGAVKLAWNPTQAERDQLYPAAINPVINQVGKGTILFGDKTATTKPSAFDRINVRRLFLILEKSIANSAKYQLFELNDAITRLQFIASVEPFLRDVKGRRGVQDYRVICDETNNTPQVVATNNFVGTILIKPNYSINFITLNFTAVGPNVSFEIAAGV